jgi:hypothetical protein
MDVTWAVAPCSLVDIDQIEMRSWCMGWTELAEI